MGDSLCRRGSALRQRPHRQTELLAGDDWHRGRVPSPDGRVRVPPPLKLRRGPVPPERLDGGDELDRIDRLRQMHLEPALQRFRAILGPRVRRQRRGGNAAHARIA